MIRKLTNEDELVKLFPLFIAEGKEVGLDVSKLNPDKLWNTLHACMTHAVILIDEQDGVIRGCMAICLVGSYWCDDFTLTNLLYQVPVEYRKSKIALELLKAAKEYAKTRGLDFELQVESYEDLDRKDKFFQRYGFKKCGGRYIFRGDK